MPPGLEHVRTTSRFDETSAPAGFRKAHRIADGVWGRLIVHDGALLFRFEDDATGVIRVESGRCVDIPPGRPHHLAFDGPVLFDVEFYR